MPTTRSLIRRSILRNTVIVLSHGLLIAACSDGHDPGITTTSATDPRSPDQEAETTVYEETTSDDVLAEGCPGAEAFVRLANRAGAEVLAIRSLRLPVTGIRACSAKVHFSDAAGEIVTVLADGSRADETELLRTERAAAHDLYGPLTPELWAALRDTPPDTLVPIWIWAKVEIDFPEKESFEFDPERAQAFSEVTLRRGRAAAEPIERALTEAGHEILVNAADTPLVRALVPAEQISRLAQMPEIGVIGSDEWPGRPAGTAWYDTIGAASAHVLTGAAGQKVCLIEGGQPDDTSQLELAAIASPGGYVDPHIRWTSGIIRNTSSFEVAPAASIFISNWAGYQGTPAAPSPTQWCTWNGARSINFSWSFESGAPGGVTGTDMTFDYMTKLSPYPLFVQAAGNTGGSPGMETVNNRAYNTLIVGASDDWGDGNPANDTIAGFSSWKNPTSVHADRELPHIVAPGVGVLAAGLDWSGTSGSAPQATGVSALVASRSSNLELWPEARRAVIIASARRNVDGPAMLRVGSGIDHRDGAGLLDAGFATTLASGSNFRSPGGAAAPNGYRGMSLSFSTDFPNGSVISNKVFNACALANGRMRFAMAWDGTASCTSNLSSCSSDTLDGDLDLEVYDSIGNLVCFSTSWDSSWEMCDMPVTAGQTFQIKIRKFAASASGTYLGMAWAFYQ